MKKYALIDGPSEGTLADWQAHLVYLQELQRDDYDVDADISFAMRMIATLSSSPDLSDAPNPFPNAPSERSFLSNS